MSVTPVASSSNFARAMPAFQRTEKPSASRCTRSALAATVRTG
jgi:hypothetical protein